MAAAGAAEEETVDLLSLDYYKNYKVGKNQIPLTQYILTGDVADKIQSGIYPSLELLARLQREKGQDPKDPRAKGVAPFPSRRMKDEIFDLEKFKDKDAYAKSVLPKAHESNDAFGQRLFRMCRSNLDKVRTAFAFICTADTHTLPAVKNESTLYQMIRLMRVDSRDLHSAVFDCLLKIADVPFKEIRGLKKGAGFQEGLKVKGSGLWYACYVEGEWRFVDAMWGSQSISGFSDGNYLDVTEQGDVSGGGASSGQTVYQCDEDYFLTDPEFLVLSHLPPEHEKEWQLLVRPLSEMEFLQMPNYFSGDPEFSRIVQLSPHSHPLNVIVAGPGNVDIFLRESGDEEYSYETELQIFAKSINDEARKAIKDTANVNGYLSKVCRMGDQLVKFKFVPPCRGQFKLKVKVKYETEHYIHIRHYAEYVIHCPQAAENVKQFPQGELDEFGAGKRLQKLGLQAEEKGEMDADDGEQQLVVRATDARTHQLQCKVEGVDAEIDKNRILIWQNQDENCFIFLAPDSGAYAMVIYDNGNPVCQYLIDAGTEVKDNNMPLPDWSQLQGLGLVNNDLGKIIFPVSHPRPYVVCDETEIEIKLKLGIDMKIKCEMMLVDSESSLIPQENYTFVNGSHEGVNVDARFAKAGNYVMRLYVQRPDSSDWESYFNYFIRALGDIDGSAQQFPQQGINWQTGFRLISPKNRFLPINKDVKMSFKVKDDSVKVAYAIDESNGNKILLSAQPDGMFSGVIKGSSGSAGAVLKVMAGADDESCDEILRFDFESDDYKQKQQQQRQQAQEINSKRQEDEERRQRKRENHDRQDKGMEVLSEDPVADRKREEEERLRKEEEERQKKEEQRRKKEEERQKKEEEERIKKEEEEKRRKEEEEQKKKDEAERKRKQEEERKQREEEERRRKEEEEQQQKEEEKRKREEKEKKRKERAEQEKLNSREKYAQRLEEQEEKKKEKKERRRKKRERKEKEKEKSDEERRRSEEKDKLMEKLAKLLNAKDPDQKAIKATLQKIDEMGIEKIEDKELVAFAERLLRALQLKQKLNKENKKSADSNDTAKVQQTMNEIEKEKFSDAVLLRLKPEMDRANQLLEQQRRSSRKATHKLDLNASTMQELYGYDNPPAAVHQAIKGVLLMLGHWEVKTRKWRRCVAPLKRSLREINSGSTEKLHPAIAARADFLLSAVDQHELQLNSAAATAMFNWALKDIQRIKSKSKPGSFKPATGPEQMKILGCTKEEKEDYDFEDGLLKKK